MVETVVIIGLTLVGLGLIREVCRCRDRGLRELLDENNELKGRETIIKPSKAM